MTTQNHPPPVTPVEPESRLYDWLLLRVRDFSQRTVERLESLYQQFPSEDLRAAIDQFNRPLDGVAWAGEHSPSVSCVLRFTPHPRTALKPLNDGLLDPGGLTQKRGEVGLTGEAPQGNILS